MLALILAGTASLTSAETLMKAIEETNPDFAVIEADASSVDPDLLYQACMPPEPLGGNITAGPEEPIRMDCPGGRARPRHCRPFVAYRGISYEHIFL